MSLICTLASLAYAAPIPVRSGAHDGFSRLVLDVSSGAAWTVENNGNSARITIENHKDGFNLQRVFDRIDRTHIAELQSRPDTLEVQFACQCALSAYKLGDQMVVLDISPNSDVPTPTVAPIEQAQPDLAAAQPLQFANTLTSKSRADSNPLPWGWSSSVDQENDAPIQKPFSEFAEGNGGTETSLERAQENIARQVGAAATRGMLTPKATPVDLPLVTTRPQVDTEIFDSSTVEWRAEQEEPALANGNLRITSSSDIPADMERFSTSTTLGIRCIDPRITAISDWANDQPFSTQIADRRNALFFEFDRLDQEAAVKLARTYLHFGFGMEVKEVIALDPQLARDNPALLEMAEIMEYGHVRRPAYLHNFMECDTDIALWAILSKQSIAPSTIINSSAALRALTALPMHLRTFIAPELSRRFLDYGAPDAAAAALRSLERSTNSLASDADLAKADIELAEGNVSDAQDRLARVVASNVEQSAEALIKFVDSHLEADGQIEQDIATLVEAYALQMRDDPIGAELQRTHVLALGKSGQFDAAFEALDRLRKRDSNRTDSYVPSALLDLLTRNGVDIEFLDHVFQQIYDLGDVVNSETIVNLTNRLVDLGFPLEAERILAARPDVPDDETTRLVRAKVALALSRPFEADALLFGVDTLEAERLRAKAKARSGAFDEAHSLFAELGQKDGSQQTAWLSDDWTSLVGQDTPVLGDVARVAQTVISDDDAPEGMLSRTSEAISESAAARSVIEELLRTSDQESRSDP